MTPLEQIYISAVRYALGRMTYIVSDTVDFMMKQKLSKECKEIMIRDIDEAIERHDTGMECDERDWDRLKECLTK